MYRWYESSLGPILLRVVKTLCYIEVFTVFFVMGSCSSKSPSLSYPHKLSFLSGSCTRQKDCWRCACFRDTLVGVLKHQRKRGWDGVTCPLFCFWSVWGLGLHKSSEYLGPWPMATGVQEYRCDLAALVPMPNYRLTSCLSPQSVCSITCLTWYWRFTFVLMIVK